MLELGSQTRLEAAGTVFKQDIHKNAANCDKAHISDTFSESGWLPG